MFLVYNSFIDGTVAGNPADLTTNIDTNVLHDHSYFGNGCSNGWDNGSKTPCSKRTVMTFDNENLNNGVYYNYQAATSGTGGAITTDNTNAPNTFCPLGWQLPYGGTGGDYYDKSRSWRYLLTRYSISNDSTGANKLRSYPFSIILSGTFHWNTGRLHLMDNELYLWSTTVKSSSHAFDLFMYASGMNQDSNVSKTGGFTVRCVPELATRIVPHGIRVHSLVLWLFIF